jgi:hypothetical protein
MTAVLGVDAGSRTAADAEHLMLGVAAELGAGPGAVLCTHAVRQGTPHYAATLTLPTSRPATLRATMPSLPSAGWALVDAAEVLEGDPVLARTALGAATGRAAGSDGRAVRFPGIELLTGTVPVADVLAGTAIDEVRVLAGGVLPPAAVLHTREFCRPVYEAGALVLDVLPAGPGRVAPFEVPNPTPCCAAHS